MSPANKDTLKPSLSEKFEGIIWKIETDDRHPLIVVESRDVSSHTAFFSAFNFKSHQCYFKNITVEDSWNWGIDRVSSQVIYLHGYQSPESPEHKGIIAINLNGEVEWQNFTRTLYAVAEEGLIVYNPAVQPRFPELVSPQSGALLQSSVTHYNPVHRHIITPDYINIAHLPADIDRTTIEGPVLYARFKQKDCYAFHVRGSLGYSQKLYIYHQGKMLHEEFLTVDIQKINPEAFFIEHEHLFCIKDNKRIIVSYLL